MARIEKAIELIDKQAKCIDGISGLVDIQKKMLDNISKQVNLLVERIELQDKILDQLRCDMIDRR